MLTTVVYLQYTVIIIITRLHNMWILNNHQSICAACVVVQVSTHGYSQNDILVWNYPTMERLGRLTGHTTRVLYLVSTCWPIEYNVSTLVQSAFSNESDNIAVFLNTFLSSLQACSPDGESIVTGAGDETLRFWRIFQKPEEFVCIVLANMIATNE